MQEVLQSVACSDLRVLHYHTIGWASCASACIENLTSSPPNNSRKSHHYLNLY